MAEQNSTKILWTIRDICDYCEISQVLFYRLVKKHRFPATILEGKWCAHADNIDEFFRCGTKTPPKELDPTAE